MTTPFNSNLTNTEIISDSGIQAAFCAGTVPVEELMVFDTNREVARSETRPVTLPCAVDEAKVEATYDNGVVKIKLPKTEESKTHKIKVHKKK